MMKKDVKKLVKELSSAETKEQVDLIKSKLSTLILIDGKEQDLTLKRKELKLKSREMELKDDELKLKKEQIANDNKNKVADLDLRKQELELHKEDLNLRKNQAFITAKNAFIQVIATAALSTAKIGLFGVLSLYMHHKENIDYEKESSFSKELRQGLLK